MAHKILVVDDEKQLVEMLTLRLEAKGYNVVAAYDGNEALKKAHSEKPDLIIIDITMPKLDGYQVCRMLKFDKMMKRIPIIILTAMSDVEDKHWGQEVKADAYITKPFDPEALMEKIASLIGS